MVQNSPWSEIFKWRRDKWLGCCVWATVGVYYGSWYVSIQRVITPGSVSCPSSYGSLTCRGEPGLGWYDLAFTKPLEEGKKWRQHVKALSEKHSFLQSTLCLTDPHGPCIPPWKPLLSVLWSIYKYLPPQTVGYLRTGLCIHSLIYNVLRATSTVARASSTSVKCWRKE